MLINADDVRRRTLANPKLCGELSPLYYIMYVILLRGVSPLELDARSI